MTGSRFYGFENSIDSSFIAPNLVDGENLLNCMRTHSPGEDDMTKKVRGLFSLLTSSFEGDYQRGLIPTTYRVLADKKSQIGNKEGVWKHWINTAGINMELTEALLRRDPNLDLPEPNLAFNLGLIHDVSAAWTKYDATLKQDAKELELYFFARHSGISVVKRHVAMHDAYFEILDMIREGVGFDRVGNYKSWTAELNSVGSPNNFSRIYGDFKGFLEGQENLSLMVLSLADNLENGSPAIDLDAVDSLTKLNADFKARTDDVAKRHYHDPKAKSESPSALGMAWIEGGALEKRLVPCKGIITTLLFGNADELARMKQERPGLWIN